MVLNQQVSETRKIKYPLNREDAVRHWCFEGCFPTKKPFIFGSISLPLTANSEEIFKEGVKKWNEIFPIEVPPTFVPIPGIIFFQGEN